MKKQYIFALSAALPLAIAFAATQNKVSTPVSELMPAQSQAMTGSLVYQLLSGSDYAYKSLPLDDALSASIYKNYIESLDENKLFFIKSDITAFSAYETNLDDAIKKKNLSPAFDIFKVYLSRLDQRVAYARSLLKQDFDFTVKESYHYDREEAAWASTEAELNTIWRQSVKNDVLRLKLAGRSMEEIRVTLDKRYSNLSERVHQLRADDVFENFMNAYGSSIDPHTSYMSPRSADNFNMSMKLSLEGVGAVLQVQDEYVVFRTIMPGSPAEKSGQIKTGDRVLAVGQGENGPMVDVVGWRIDDVVAKIRGDKGSVVRLDVQSIDEGVDGPHKIVRIVRDKVKLEEQAASKKIITSGNKRIGVIELQGFYLDFEAARRGDPDARSATTDVRKLLEELKQENVDGVVMDLRNNGGGSLIEAVELTGLFIKQGPVLQVRSTNGDIQVEADTDPAIAWTGPLAVLVNRSSASASEIFAAAIQDYGRGLIIGEPTFGKGTVQTLIDLDKFPRKTEDQLGQLKMTVAQFFRINGGTTQNAAVSPDVLFPVSVDASEYGESTYDNAIPYTEISVADYQALGSFKAINAQLDAQHKVRIKQDKEFSWWMQDVAYYKSERDKKSISLNEQERLAERNALKAQRAAREQERKALGLASLGDDNNDDGLQAGERNIAEQVADEKKAKERPDPLMNEAAYILADAIELLESDKPLLTKVFPNASSSEIWTH
ncbi:MAG TPA: carboxy terminal-processing peptidase [Arenimonas sp.]|nr:carboxy terminal-processing peptidase [Arenimonas sp.]